MVDALSGQCIATAGCSDIRGVWTSLLSLRSSFERQLSFNEGLTQCRDFTEQGEGVKRPKSRIIEIAAFARRALFAAAIAQF
ncbi:hypothetical protein DOTSEDRAFT_67936 [Dothistroma septosporum NZE10]|uniref:Uncharacterized protein n=1 Tax=Dothistroma septosporum (strain NZE10 / CBS 128990) TaxID=675120 RepID=N1Q3N4_DOTSN|nr:hypothetical protein DOTSEDRAFT_67936 [Dothistroma septosporum NZE10]